MKKIISLSYLGICLLPLNGISQMQAGTYLGYTPELNQLHRPPSFQLGDAANGTTILGHSPILGIDELNNLIHYANYAGLGSGKTLSYPWGLTWGVDLRYQWNSLFLRLAVDHTWQMGGRSGELSAGGFENKISYKSWAFSLPITFGFSHGLAEFYHFYLGLGPYFGMAYLQVTHSAPQAFAHLGPLSFPSVPPQKIELYGNMLGFHALFGLQFPVIPKKIYLALDFLYYSAQSSPLLAKGVDATGNPLTSLYMPLTQRGHRFLIGVQYLIPL